MCVFNFNNTKKLHLKIALFLLFTLAFLIWGSKSDEHQEHLVSQVAHAPQDHVINTPQDHVIKKTYQTKQTTPKLIMEEKLHFSEQFGLKDLNLPIDANKKYYSAVYSNKTPSISELDDIGEPYGIPKGVLYYQMMQESRGLPTKGKNHKGAKGYFQFQDGTARQTGLLTDDVDYRNNAYASADASARYLLWNIIVLHGVRSSLLDGDNLSYALAAYNAGHKRLTMGGKTKLPPFYETIKYVNEITTLSSGGAVLVKPGETLRDISARTNVESYILLESNPSIQGTADLKAYQTLYLPDQNGHSQVVIKRGMSLFGLEKDTGIAINDIKVANNMTSDVIRVADIVILPTSLSAIGIERRAISDSTNLKKHSLELGRDESLSASLVM
jgi:LysM repeat protein